MPRRKDSKYRIAVPLLAVILTGGALLRMRPQGGSGTATSDSSLASTYLAHKVRWGTKTGVDPDAAKVDVAHPQTTTVAELTALPRPDGLPDREGPGSDRIGPVEHTAYTIDAKVLRYKLEEEDDQDFHIVITDWNHPGPTMIVEIPDPRAVGTASPWRDAIASARDRFDSEFHPEGRFTRRSAHLKITGIGFFDFIHGQRGVAPNGIELHPVIGVEEE